MISKLVLLCGLVAMAECAYAPNLPGGCPDIKAMENIDAEKAGGEWWEHSHGITGDADTKDLNNIEKCEKKTVKNTPNGVELVKTYIDGSGKEQSKTMTAKKVAGTQAIFTVTSDDLTAKGLTATSYILDTDYTNKMVQAVCYTDGSKHGIMVGIYGRGKTLAAADVDTSKETLKSANINVELTSVDQSC